MKKINESLIIEKKSKFIGLLYEVNDVSEVNDVLSSLKEEHKRARHICYAYKIGPLAKKSDDKEPSGSAGNPIYSVIERNNLDNTLIVVIRYFGGTLLGVGPLTRCYSKASSLLVTNNK